MSEVLYRLRITYLERFRADPCNITPSMLRYLVESKSLDTGFLLRTYTKLVRPDLLAVVIECSPNIYHRDRGVVLRFAVDLFNVDDSRDVYKCIALLLNDGSPLGQLFAEFVLGDNEIRAAIVQLFCESVHVELLKSITPIYLSILVKFGFRLESLTVFQTHSLYFGFCVAANEDCIQYCNDKHISLNETEKRGPELIDEFTRLVVAGSKVKSSHLRMVKCLL